MLRERLLPELGYDFGISTDSGNIIAKVYCAVIVLNLQVLGKLLD